MLEKEIAIADNITLNSGTGGAVVRTDEDGSLNHWQYVKLAYGPDNTQTIVSTTNPVPVDLRADNLGGNLDVNLAASGATVTVSNSVLSVVGPGTEAAAQRVTIANDSTGLVSVDDGGGSLTVDGTVAVSGTVAVDLGANNDVTNTTLSVVGPGTEATAQRVTIANDSTGVVSVDDNGGSLTVDGTVTANAGTGTFAISNSTLAVVGGGTEAAAMRVTLANDSTGVVSVDDGGGSLTVDGTVAVSGTVTVDLGVNNDVTNTTLSVTGGGTEAAAQRVTLANDSTGVLSVDDNGGSLTVDGSVTLGANSGVDIGDVDILSMPAVQGLVASNAVMAGNPVPIAARADANEPTAVAAGDSTYLWADLYGRLVVVPGHPDPEQPVSVTATSSGETTIIAAPGANLHLCICKGSVHNSDAATEVAGLRVPLGSNLWQAELAADGGGSTFDFGANGWRLPANTALAANLASAGSVTFNITEYYIAS